MATTMKPTAVMCLVVLSYIAISEAFPHGNGQQSIYEHLTKSCPGYEEKKRGEGGCNSEVLDHVHDYAEGLRETPGYNGDRVESYLDQANNKQLCYLDERSVVQTVFDGCAAMEIVCATPSTVVDRCTTLKARRAFHPPTMPTRRGNTNPPPTPGPTTAVPATTV
nr:uncharacterized protein LOC129280793 [Lytechinus pictus]